MARSRSRPRFALLSLLPTALLAFVLSSSLGEQGVQAATTCGYGSNCPKDSPCCSAEGTCGSGAFQCAGGCNPLYSFSATSCLPNPICTSQNITLSPSDATDQSKFRNILKYNGDPSEAPFTLDSGSLGKGPEGVLMELTADRQAKFSTTQYILYGEVEATIRHDPVQGLVAAFIFMSDIKDEIDWEFTTANATDAQTNYFGMGQYVATHGQTIKTNSSFSVSDWHTFGVNWQPDQLQWKIDGNVVRTLKKSDAGGYFPRSPSRVQFSTWAGGNETNAQGTIDWSGGPIDWSSDEYKKNGYYSQEIKQLVVNCASQNVANISTDGTGNDVTAWYYTGANSSSTGEPEFKMTTNAISTLKDPAKDGVPGMPGYSSSSSSGSSSSSSGSSFSNKNGSTSSSENNSNPNWSFNKNAALKYGIPIAAAGVGLILLWALIVALIRRRRNAKLAAPGAAGLAANSASSAFGGGAAGLATRGGGIGNTSRYAPLHDVDDAPAGARRVGHGYAGGPAQGQGARYAGAGYGGYEAYDMQTRHEMSPAPSRGYGHQQQPSLGGSPYPYREPRYTGYRD